MPAYDYYDEEAKKNGKAAITPGNPAAGVPRTKENLGAPKTVVSKADNAASGASSLTGQAVGSETVNMRTNRNAATMPVNGNGIASQAMTQNMYSPEKSNLASDLTEGAESVSKWNENADFGVRNYLEQELGIDGKRIGFDGENVTFDGNPLIKAERVSDEGRSYVGDKSAVDAAVSQYAQEHGLVAARDYANSLGVPMNIQWDETQGSVVINGVPMKPDFISNGKAYVYQEKLDAVLKKADNGFKTYKDHKKDAYDKYGAGMEEAYNDYMNYGDFSYDQKDDRAYQDFMDVYRRAVEDEYNANMAQARFRTGGLASPAVMSQAAAVRSRALDDAAMYGQQYEDRAYEKWKDSRDFTADKIQTAWDMMKGTYDLESGAEKADREAWQQQYENSRNDQQFERLLKTLDQAIEKGYIELGDAYSDSEVKRKENALYLRDADYYADAGKEKTKIELDTARENYKILEQYGLPMMQEEYSNLVFSNQYLAERINQFVKEGKISKAINLVNLARGILENKVLAKESGETYSDDEMWKIYNGFLTE